MASKWVLSFTLGAFTGAAGKTFIWDLFIKSTDENGLKSLTSTHLASLLPYGVPLKFPEAAVYKNHILHYDHARKIPLWVAEHITLDHVKGSANRKHSKFKPDPGVPEMYSAQNKDYFRSGWSRGHMAPAGNNKHNQEAMDQSFYLTNVLPQDLNNNGDFWNRLEMYCRSLTKHFSHVRLISGPLILPTEDDTGKKYIKHQVIGENEVTVPTHLYKVVLVEDNAKRPLALASFVVPNQPIPRSHQLESYKVPLEYVERKSGFTFLPKLDRNNVQDLCKFHNCDLMSSDKFELYFATRKMSSANTLHRLEKVWKELEEKDLKPDEYTQNVYNTRREELLEKGGGGSPEL